MYKYRTQKIHEEYHVRCHPMVFPGVTLRPEHQNPFLLISFTDDELSSAIENRDCDMSEQINPDRTHTDNAEHGREISIYQQSSGVDTVNEIPFIDTMSSSKKLSFDGQLCQDMEKLPPNINSIHNETFAGMPNEGIPTSFESLPQSKILPKDITPSNLSIQKATNFEIVLDNDSDEDIQMENVDQDMNDLGSFPSLLTESNDKVLESTDFISESAKPIESSAFQAYANRCAHFNMNSELAAEYGIQYPIKITDENINDLPNLFALQIVDEFATNCGKFVALHAKVDLTKDPQVKKRIKKSLKRSTKRVLNFYESKLDNLEVFRNYLNKDRKIEDQINWKDIADTAVLPEKINKLDAPPPPQTMKELVNHSFSRYFK